LPTTASPSTPARPTDRPAPPASTSCGPRFDLLRDEVDLDGRYADPDLAATRTPARIGAAMRRQCARQLARLRWDGATVARILGSWLSEPKPTVFFAPPPRPLARAAFARRLARHGVRLDRKTQLLYDDRHLLSTHRCRLNR
jgi:50S ribosomal protein L16 3-hydroxylase